MYAIALPAADSTQPALNAVTTTAVPTATDKPPAACALKVTLARAPSEARSSTQTVRALWAPTATAHGVAPADRITAGAAPEMATGSIDNALASDALGGWARTLPR